MNVLRAALFCIGVAAISAAPAGKSKAAKSKAGDPARGKVVFQQCEPCHSPASGEKKIGPGLKGLFHRPKLSNGKPVSEENVMSLINSGGGGMPPYKDILSDKERADLLAYLKTL